MGLNGYTKSVATAAAIASTIGALVIWVHKHEMDSYRIDGRVAMDKISHIEQQQDSVRLEIAIERFERQQLGASLDSLADEVKHLKEGK